MGVRGRGHWAGSGEHSLWSAITEETGDGDLGGGRDSTGERVQCVLDGLSRQSPQSFP